MELDKIAVLGPGGNVGSAVITRLLRSWPGSDITAITRQTSSYSPPPDSGILHTKADYESFDTLVDAFAGQDAVVNCITGIATQYDPSKRIVDAAVAAGVKFFFANEFVANMESEQARRLPESHAGAKYRIREYLKELASEEKIAWTGLNGGPFFDMWLMKGPAGFDIANRRARIYGTGDNILCWTPLPIMGLTVANMLRNPGPVTNRSIFICPFSDLTQNKLLSNLEKVLGENFDAENVDVKKINEHARIALERGEAAKAMKGLAVSNQFYEDDCGNDFRHLVENDLVGVEMMSVEDAVRDALERYGEDCKVVEALFKVDPCEI
ncbi:hypothetical protein HBI56_194480 [Parastagonospora nodorum]|nr:hypothetical protein HBH53_189350 [Parastagonospora nodorum]KAH3967221.1 hypothetical protein HBH52_191410 [Parastagonospora nodorum]KAH3993043.1 hypothetical protein HBI10_207880 [Parastagonospora nodorum]KAH4010846.1 hypothetical protein HBI13_203580 [Parastagonospora nodorum]KAH4019268.1 hypothetical protein HBI09_187180 [Parastagonospora nodorum]